MGKVVDKCEEVHILEDRAIYLGFVISRDGLKMDLEKVQAIIV